MKGIRLLVPISLSMTVLAPPVQAGIGEHCSFRLVPVFWDGATTTASLELIGCYATYEQALEAGSGQALDAAPGVTPGSLAEDDLVYAVASDVLIGTEWVNTSYGGSSASFYATSTCTANQSWQVSYVGDAWNDRFKSGKGFGGCDTNKKFRHSNFGGDVIARTPNCSNYGTLAGEVSSLRWKA